MTLPRPNNNNNHHHHHHHHHRGPRPRPRSDSISRSSSSPSPPPPSTPNGLPISGTRRSFTTTRSPAGVSRGGRIAIPSPSLPAPTSPLTGSETTYGASASSPAGAGDSMSERDRDWFVSVLGDETEMEADRRGSRGRTGAGQINGESKRVVDRVQLDDKLSPPPGQSNNRNNGTARRISVTPHAHLVPPSHILLPFRMALTQNRNSTTDRKGKGRALPAFPHIHVSLTRRRCETLLLLGGVGWGAWTLGHNWQEHALAGEISLLLGLSILYTALRCKPLHSRSTSPPPQRPVSPGFPTVQLGSVRMRERSARQSNSHGASGFLASQNGALRDEGRGRFETIGAEATGEDATSPGSRGCIWGTEEREYRECLDDGVLFALLLGPLVASALLHASLTQLSNNPSEAVLPGWEIESPLVLPSTPIRQLPGRIPAIATDAIRALSALATSRRNLVQLFTLCSFVLLVQLTRSLHLERKLDRTTVVSSAALSGTPMERDSSEPSRAPLSGTYWLRKGEWRRNLSVVGFAFLVTAGCVVVKIVTAYIGRGVWSDMSASDIIIATLFYQFSLYVCVRLARRGFTLGELAVVCNAATALFMETVNLTRMQIAILRTPYIKTYRLPTPLLTFQLALIPGSLLAGFLLSPLLYLSRHLAQRPAHRLRFPHEKPVHRRLLALGFYLGAALVCGGLVGFWTRWCLGWRDPWVWVMWFLVEGKRGWTRPALISYWGALAAISVAGWNRQLSRARRHRRYVVPGTRPPGDSGAPTTNNGGNSTPGQSGAVDGRLSGVATQMMDAADQRLPTLSVNARRKFFHALAVVMFIPGIAVDPAFTHLSFSVAFAAFNFAEYVRYFALWPFGVSVHLFLNEFLDHKDSGTAILSHFYLLAGCASPLWLEGPTEILAYFGVLSLGIGDALASIIGRRWGRIRWSAASGKTVEGSIAFFSSVMLSSVLLWAFGLTKLFNIGPYAVATALASLLEAVSAQNDNLILPMYGWALGTLLGV
ncbi:hypothetical protein BCR39DRAFT_551328 [Naematelia encephala]|uniref:dolichol kinase n=1 Tax=Naematelia encephala TaxID=71784 RepID=A0A1Y2AJ66_9TREE|nr:hypothetical protein BCR39DRAFT_551328 [Naematelia encephala]